MLTVNSEGPNGGVTTRDTWCILMDPETLIIYEPDLEEDIPVRQESHTRHKRLNNS